MADKTENAPGDQGSLFGALGPAPKPAKSPAPEQRDVLPTDRIVVGPSHMSMCLRCCRAQKHIALQRGNQQCSECGKVSVPS